MTAAALWMSLAAVVALWPVGVPRRRVHAATGDDGRPGARGRSSRIDGWVVGGCACAVGSLVVVGTAAGVAAGIVTAAVLRHRRRRRRERARDAELDAVLDAVTVIVAEMSVGAHPARACRQAADDLARRPSAEGVAPTLEVVTAMAGRAELGGDVAAGLQSVGGERSHAWARIGVAWRTAEDHGLPMADLVQSVRDDLVARRRFAERTRAALAGARATAAVLAGLPVLGVLLGEAMGARPVAVLLGGGLGGILLVVGVTLVVAGLAWTQRITDKVMTP
ncbi:type II secretion system F family protein [Williamsia serinedens]|uniref:Tight adherence protein B n=1 Tax=Williamsia serinedens TaxID=391736 RepID=A0ABT1H6F6_9NOCA|nr:type II secretion system protein F [Williamsia serinedens]MCP2162220.1 tight adherence protein B [Williamsia serinedens]